MEFIFKWITVDKRLRFLSYLINCYNVTTNKLLQRIWIRNLCIILPAILATVLFLSKRQIWQKTKVIDDRFNIRSKLICPNELFSSTQKYWSHLGKLPPPYLVIHVEYTYNTLLNIGFLSFHGKCTLSLCHTTVVSIRFKGFFGRFSKVSKILLGIQSVHV